MKTNSVPFAAKRTITLLRILRGWLLATNQPTITDSYFLVQCFRVRDTAAICDTLSFLLTLEGNPCRNNFWKSENRSKTNAHPWWMHSNLSPFLKDSTSLLSLIDVRCVILSYYLHYQVERACSLSWKWIILVACTLVSYYKWASLDTHLFQLGPQDNGV